jgi:hypothetical protein
MTHDEYQKACAAIDDLYLKAIAPDHHLNPFHVEVGWMSPLPAYRITGEVKEGEKRRVTRPPLPDSTSSLERSD